MDDAAGRLTPNPTVVSQPTKDGAVLLEVTTGDCFELNEVGAQIWAALGKGEPLAVIVTNLAGRYGVPSSTIEADANSLIDDLKARGLLSSR